MGESDGCGAEHPRKFAAGIVLGGLKEGDE